jgi:hypothetical protein
MNLSLQGFGKFLAVKDPFAVRIYLFHVADESMKGFKRGMLGKHTGRVYQRKGYTHRASAVGEYPARDSGALFASMDTDVNANKATIGTNMHYSKHLAYGTSKMSNRKMSIDALKEGRAQAPKLGRFVKWKSA